MGIPIVGRGGWQDRDIHQRHSASEPGRCFVQGCLQNLVSIVRRRPQLLEAMWIRIKAAAKVLNKFRLDVARPARKLLETYPVWSGLRVHLDRKSLSSRHYIGDQSRTRDAGRPLADQR